MEAAFDEQRARVARLFVRLAEAAVVAHAGAVFVACVDHDVFGRAHLLCELQVAWLHASQRQRCAGLVHGVQVEHPVRLLNERSQLRGAAALCRVGRVDAVVAPLAVQVLIDEA